MTGWATYDDMFPAALVGTETFYSMIAKRGDEKPCATCGSATQWESYSPVARSCSPSCTRTLRDGGQGE